MRTALWPSRSQRTVTVTRRERLAPLARRRPLSRLPADLVVPRPGRCVPGRSVRLCWVPEPSTVSAVRPRQRHHPRHLGRRNRIEAAGHSTRRKERAGSRGRPSWKQRTPTTRQQAADHLKGVTEEVSPAACDLSLPSRVPRREWLSSLVRPGGRSTGPSGRMMSPPALLRALSSDRPG